MVLPMPRPTSRPDSRFLQARKIIPAELRPILGRREFKRPLRATCRAEVKRLHLEAMAEWDAQIAAARAKLRGDLRTLTAREVDAFCGRWYADEAAKYADDPGSAAEWDQHLSHYAGYFHSAPGEDSEFIKDRALSDEAGAWLTAQGIAADTPSLLRFARRWAETQIRFARAMLRRVEGDWSEDPNLAAFPPPIPAPQSAPAAAPEPAPPPSLTFAALLQAWAVEAQTAPKTRAKWEAAFANLASVIGHDDAARLTVADVRAWKQARFNVGRSAKTVSDGVTGLRGVVGWGIRNGLLPGPTRSRAWPRRSPSVARLPAKASPMRKPPSCYAWPERKAGGGAGCRGCWPSPGRGSGRSPTCAGRTCAKRAVSGYWTWCRPP